MERKKILLVSNMYPSKTKPYAGVFVKNQYEYFTENYREEYSLDIFYMKRTFNSILGSVLKYFKASLSFFRQHFFKTYDIIHLHFFFPLIVVVYTYMIFHPKTKLVVTFHGSDVTKSGRTNLLRVVFRFFARKIDYYISVGNELSEKIEENLRIKEGKVICAGVDQRVFFPISNEPAKKYDYIFVGSFFYGKGIDMIIEAIKIIGDKEIKFCFVGSGPFYVDLLKLKEEEYDINIFENKTQIELRQLYNEAKFLLLPSRWEAFGLVATEAVFCGTPIIVSTNGGLKDQLIKNKTGFFASTTDQIVDVISQTLKLNKEQYQELVKNCLSSNQEYSLLSVCNEIENVYKELLSSRV